MKKHDLATLQAIYNSEINFTLENFWDGGFRVTIGDDCNGILAVDHSIYGIENAVDRLVELVLITHPKSKFAVEYNGGVFTTEGFRKE